MSIDAKFLMNGLWWAPTSGMVGLFANEDMIWKEFRSHAISYCKQKIVMMLSACKFGINTSIVYSFEHSKQIQRWISLNSDRVTPASPPRSDYPFR